MKCSFLKFSLIGFLMLLCLNYYFVNTNSLSTKNLNNFNELEARSVALYARNANCGNKPLLQTCPKCVQPDGGYKMFFFYQYTRLRKYNYKFFIHYNDQTKQVIVSFGAPSVENHTYIKRIYSRGWSLLRLFKVRVEKEFRVVYYKNMRRVLAAKIQKIKQSGRANYRFLFTGYSLGGSLAVLAAFDLTYSKIVCNRENRTAVYTYGALRIGDQRFVALVNSSLRLWRVVKQDDYIVRIPNCYYSVPTSSWRCFTKPVIRKYILTNKFPLKVYIRHYLRKSPLARTKSTPIFLEQSHRKWVKPQIVPSVRSTLINTYYKYIFYTQPLGREIFYNPAMTSYRPCVYVQGVSNCDKIVSLPTSFTTNSHKVYYGINFDQC
jgi:hypothetical protein